MSDLYEFECTKQEGNVVEALCRVVHPDAGYFPSHPATALMILWESAPERSPLRTELGNFESLMNRFLGGPAMGERGNEADGFIESVEILDQGDFPSGDEPEAGEALPTAMYQIRVRHPRWVEHLHSGNKWNSTAYD